MKRELQFGPRTSDLGCFPICQNFRKFRSKHKWNASVQVEIFWKKRSTPKGASLDRSSGSGKTLVSNFRRWFSTRNSPFQEGLFTNV